MSRGGLVDGVEQDADLFQGESRLLGDVDDPEPLQGVGGKPPLAADPLGFREEAVALVVANRGGVDLRQLDDFPQW